MGIIAWLVFGGLAGWVASMVMDTNKEQGILNKERNAKKQHTS